MVGDYFALRVRVGAPDFERGTRIAPLLPRCADCLVTSWCQAAPALSLVASVSPLIVTLLAAGLWLGAQHRRGRAITHVALTAAAIVVPMALAPAIALPLSDFHGGPLIALLVIPPLWGGLWLSLNRPLFVSRLVSTATLIVGVVAFGFGLAVAHDDRIAMHPRIFPKPGLHPLPMNACQSVRGDEVIYLWQKWIAVHGESAMETEELDRFVWDHVSGAPISLAVSPLVSLDRLRLVLWVHQARGGDAVNFISWTKREPLWTVDAAHLHACSLHIEVSDEGIPITDFADWPALLRAADRDGPPLRLRVR
jgi:hypothetical protein